MGLIHHSDPGVRYAPWEYVQILKDHGLHISMARKRSPYDNPFVEGSIKTLKHEEVYLWECRTLEDV